MGGTSHQSIKTRMSQKKSRTRRRCCSRCGAWLMIWQQRCNSRMLPRVYNVHMDDKEQVRLILQHVMGYFVLDETATGWHTPVFAKGRNAPAGFHWPIAFWNTDGECWMTRDIATDPTVFDPLHDMNDAWQVLRRMADQEFEELHSPFAYRLGVTFATQEGFDTFSANLDQLAAWTPEKI